MSRVFPQVERNYGSKTSLDREEDVGSGSGDEEVAQRRFAEMHKQNEEAYKTMLGQASRSLLEQCSLDLEGQQKEADKQKKAKAQRKRRQKTTGERMRKMNRPIGVFCIDVDSEDDSELSLSPVRKTARTVPTRKVISSAGAAASASAVADSGSGGPGIKPQVEGGEPGGDLGGEPGGELGGEPGGEEGGAAKRKRGNPGTSVKEKTQELWDEFNGEGSPVDMWGSQQELKLRQVIRWANQARTNATKAKTPQDRDAVELQGKMLNVIDSGLKLSICLRHFPPTFHLKPLQRGIGVLATPLGASRLRVERT